LIRQARRRFPSAASWAARHAWPLCAKTSTKTSICGAHHAPKKRNTLTSSVGRWVGASPRDEGEPIHDNLSRVLGCTLPGKEAAATEEGANIGCGICYALRLRGEVPTVLCSLSSCNKAFHEVRKSSPPAPTLNPNSPCGGSYRRAWLNGCECCRQLDSRLGRFLGRVLTAPPKSWSRRALESHCPQDIIIVRASSSLPQSSTVILISVQFLII